MGGTIYTKMIVELRMQINDILSTIYKLIKSENYTIQTIKNNKVLHPKMIKLQELCMKISNEAKNNVFEHNRLYLNKCNINITNFYTTFDIPNLEKELENRLQYIIQSCIDLLEKFPAPLPPSLPLPREIKHFWYRGWPDHGIPIIHQDKSVFVVFNYFIDSLNNDIKKNGGNTVIHCSAGVGRSGVIYVILMLLNNRKIKKISIEELIILIYETIDKAREERVSIVQTAIQFRFIFYYLATKFNIKHSFTVNYINTCINNVLDKLFDSSGDNALNVLKKRYDQDHSILKDVTCNNLALNRYSDILPYKHTNITVDGKVCKEDCSNYINASKMSNIPNPNPKSKTVIINQDEIQYNIPMNTTNDTNNNDTNNNDNDDNNDNDNDNFTVIIAQGPKANTILHFKEMLKRYNTKRIVMVTNLIEAGKQKCDSYINVYDNDSDSDSDISNGGKTNMEKLPNLVDLNKPMYNTLTLDANLNLYMVKNTIRLSRNSRSRKSSSSESLQSVSSIRRRVKTQKTLPHISSPHISLPPKLPSKTNFYLREQFSKEFNNTKNNELINEIIKSSYPKNNKTKSNLKSNTKTKKYSNKELLKIKTLEEFKVLMNAYYNKNNMNVFGFLTDTIETLKRKFEKMIFNKILETQRALKNKNSVNYRRANREITQMYNDYNQNEDITTFTIFIEESHHLLEAYENFIKKIRHTYTANSQITTKIDKQKKIDEKEEIIKIESKTFDIQYQNDMSRIYYTYMPFEALNRLTPEDITKITLRQFQDVSKYYGNRLSWSNYIDYDIKKQFRKRVITLAKHFYLDMIKHELKKTTTKPKNIITVVKKSLINEMKQYDFVTTNEVSDSFFKDMNEFINSCFTTDGVKLYKDEDNKVYYGFTYTDY